MIKLATHFCLRILNRSWIDGSRGTPRVRKPRDPGVIHYGHILINWTRLFCFDDWAPSKTATIERGNQLMFPKNKKVLHGENYYWNNPTRLRVAQASPHNTSSTQAFSFFQMETFGVLVYENHVKEGSLNFRWWEKSSNS